MRIGKFVIPKSILDDENFHIVLSKMKFIPFRVEYDYSIEAMEYCGKSYLFEDIENGCVAPEYTISVEELRNDEGNIIDYMVRVNK